MAGSGDRNKPKRAIAITEIRTLSIKAQSTTSTSISHKENKQLREERRKVKALEKELARKEKALAETAALLVLREKFNALWETNEED